MQDSPIIVALDYADKAQALDLLGQLDPKQCKLKIGKHMFTRFGPDIVKECSERGFQIFLDLKFHDIPNTVGDACYTAAEIPGVWMLNVHASGGKAMLTAARDAIDKIPSDQRPLLIGVTVLTSLTSEDLARVGFNLDIDECVLRLATLCHQCGLDGVVCSPQEVSLLRESLPVEFKLITPGIRLEKNNDDQKRVMTPQAALQAGADFLVIGRPITQSKDPQHVIDSIINFK